MTDTIESLRAELVRALSERNVARKWKARAERAEAERDALNAAVDEYLACDELMRRDGCPNDRWEAALAALDAALAKE